MNSQSKTQSSLSRQADGHCISIPKVKPTNGSERCIQSPASKYTSSATIITSSTWKLQSGMANHSSSKTLVKNSTLQLSLSYRNHKWRRVTAGQSKSVTPLLSITPNLSSSWPQNWEILTICLKFQQKWLCLTSWLPTKVFLTNYLQLLSPSKTRNWRRKKLNLWLIMPKTRDFSLR